MSKIDSSTIIAMFAMAMATAMAAADQFGGLKYPHRAEFSSLEGDSTWPSIMDCSLCGIDENLMEKNSNDCLLSIHGERGSRRQDFDEESVLTWSPSDTHFTVSNEEIRVFDELSGIASSSLIEAHEFRIGAFPCSNSRDGASLDVPKYLRLSSTRNISRAMDSALWCNESTNQIPSTRGMPTNRLSSGAKKRPVSVITRASMSSSLPLEMETESELKAVYRSHYIVAILRILLVISSIALSKRVLPSTGKGRTHVSARTCTKGGLLINACSPIKFLAMGAVLLLSSNVFSASEAVDLRENIELGKERCFKYDQELKLFQLTCEDLTWLEEGYAVDTHISLGANETFDGGHGSGNSINLDGIVDFQGLFSIKDDEVKSLAEAPLIQNVHVGNGTTAESGGFIVRKGQKRFVVDSCSSTGSITKSDAGGICGEKCGTDGNIKILDSYSTGQVIGPGAGGILGGNAGHNRGRCNVTQCYSTGNIKAVWAGGVCGRRAGGNGEVTVTHSYSTGDILLNASDSGGIVGPFAAENNGYVYVEECYSKGKISADMSGGIAGRSAARRDGQVNITNCFSRGDIQAKEAGGITGGSTGGCCSFVGSDYGTVNITNTYASGVVKHVDAGAIIGSVSSSFSNGDIEVRHSVCNGQKLTGNDPAAAVNEEGNSDDLNDIRGQLYHYGGIQQWKDARWAVDGEAELPLLRFQLSSTENPANEIIASPSPTPSRSPIPDADLRGSIIEGNEPCFQYTLQSQSFQLTCGKLEWAKQGYEADNYISLGANEVFDGGDGSYGRNIIDLSGVANFKGLFAIADEVMTFANAPLIKNVHMENGETEKHGGFIVRQKQKYFKVDSCSSTGKIGSHSGGICGHKCAREGGQIRISSAYSTGEVSGFGAGGIAGDQVGYDGGAVKITHCNSTGTISGALAGGISGTATGYTFGEVDITQSHSSGDVRGLNAGGIVSRQAGLYKGNIRIRECYTTGKISGDGSGGIAGSTGAGKEGNVTIIDCYSRGDISGDEAGGITGKWTGGCCTTERKNGNVYITRAYASGTLTHESAGGIIGSIRSGFLGVIQVTYSIYSGRIVGDDPDNLLGATTGTSDDLNDIRGKLYHYNGIQRWGNDTWRVVGADSLPSLHFQPITTPRPTMTMTPTATPTATAVSATPTPSVTPSKTTIPVTDLRNNIIAGSEPCFEFIPELKLFRMICSVLEWDKQGYGADNFISLGASETFDGVDDGTAMNVLDLSRIDNFRGLFTIRQDVTTSSEAPLIRNVHIRNGKLAKEAGYIVQKEQKYFVVDSCSSSGNITEGGGGICGYRCGLNNGWVKIVNSYSTGRIEGDSAGGISGQLLGHNGGAVNITQCYSTGDMEGSQVGGICGDMAGYSNGQVNVTRSSSVGNMLAGSTFSGGIVGSRAGMKGDVNIQACYSTGRIGEKGGGISGGDTAEMQGKVNITDCYTRGSISGSKAGGITGRFGEDVTGHVHVNRSYASGMVERDNAGGIIGSIHHLYKGNVKVEYSVHNHADIVGEDAHNHLETIGNSASLNDIRGALYHYGGIQRWNRSVWAVTGNENLPVLRFQIGTEGSSGSRMTATPTPTLSSTPTISRTSTVSPTPTVSSTPSKTSTPEPDLRHRVLQGLEACFSYNAEKKKFWMTCSVVKWQEAGYGADNYISLRPNEIFDGGDGSRGGGTIDLGGVDDFKGLFTISEDVTTFTEAPLIRNIQVKNGRLADNAGFMVQEAQRFFIIDSCSSEANVTNAHAGGLCGSRCGRDSGEIKISNSHARGMIMGFGAGGIAGERVGENGGIVYITHCYSTGTIEGQSSGGICGEAGSSVHGQLNITSSYSLGDIRGFESGGVIGSSGGNDHGLVRIRNCYTFGKISGLRSGGIAGGNTARKMGKVHIRDSYSRGDILGEHAGGITGGHAGGCCDASSPTGTISITNSYAAGAVHNANAGAIIGSIYIAFSGDVEVKYSVHNGPKVVGDDPENHLDENATIGNSGNLDDIRGQLYHYDGVRRWSDLSWAVDGPDEFPILRFQVKSVASATSTPERTSAASSSPLGTITATPVLTETPITTATASTILTTSTATVLAATVTPTKTGASDDPSTLDPGLTPTRSAVPTRTADKTSSATPMAASVSSPPTSTETSTPSVSGTPTVTPSPIVHPVPSIKRIELDRFETSISITFNVPTDGGGDRQRRERQFDCLNLVQWNFRRDLNPFRSCIWRDNYSQIDISLKRPDAAVFNEADRILGVNSTLMLQGGLIRNVRGSASLEEQLLNVPAPTPHPQVSFRMDYLRFISVCRGNSITTSYFQGGDRRVGLMWKWELVENHPTDLPKLSALREKLSEATSHDAEMIRLGENHLAPGSTYVLKVTVSNIYGSTETLRIKFFTADDRDLFVDVIESPERNVQSLDALHFSVRSDIEQCGQSNVSSALLYSFTYTWSILQADGLPLPTVDLEANDPRQLNIPAGFLSPHPQPYNISVTVRASPQSSTARNLAPVKRDFEIKVDPSPVNAIIEGGDRSAGINKTLSLDATASGSPDDFTNENSSWLVSYEYSWRCSFPPGRMYDKQCSKFLDDNNTPRLEIAPKTLRAMQASTEGVDGEVEFVINVTYVVESKTTDDLFVFKDSDRIFITLLEESPPNVQFVSIGPNNFETTTSESGRDAFLVNAFDKIELEAAVEVSEANEGQIERKWELIDGDELIETSVGEANDEVLVGGLFGSKLRIRPESLTPGDEYVLRFKSYFSGNPDNYGFTDVRLVVNTPPRGGTVNVHTLDSAENNGSVILGKDEVMVEATGWSDENPPFTYRFFYTYDGQTPSTLAWRSSSTQRIIRTNIPLPENGEHTSMVIVCEIRDSLGARTFYRLPFDDLAYPAADALEELAEEKFKEVEECTATKDAACGLLALRDGWNAKQLGGGSNARSLQFSSDTDPISQLEKILQFLSMDDVEGFTDTFLLYAKALQADFDSMIRLLNILEDLLDWIWTSQGAASLESLPSLAEKYLAGISHILDRSSGNIEVEAAADPVIRRIIQLVHRSELGFSNFIALQPPFSLYKPFCDQKQNLGIVLQNTEFGKTTTVEAERRHGFGLSKAEYQNCDNTPIDTNEDERIVPRAILNLTSWSLSSVGAPVVVLKEYAELPISVLPSGKSFGIVVQEANSTVGLMTDLQYYIDTNLIPSGNAFSRSDVILNNAVGGTRRLTARDLVNTVDSGVISRKVAVKSVDVRVENMEAAEQTEFSHIPSIIELPLYPETNVDLGGSLDALSISSGEQEYPHQIVTCRQGLFEINCQTKSLEVSCGSSLEGAKLKVFCPVNVLIPGVVRRKGDSWTAQGLSLKSFDGRTLRVSTEELGLHSASLHSVDIEPFARLLSIPMKGSSPEGTAMEEGFVLARTPFVESSSGSGMLPVFDDEQVQNYTAEFLCDAIDVRRDACSFWRYFSDAATSTLRRLSQSTWFVDVIVRSFVNGEPVLSDLDGLNVTDAVEDRLHEESRREAFYSSMETRISFSKADSMLENVVILLKQEGSASGQNEGTEDNDNDGDGGASSSDADGSQMVILGAGLGTACAVGFLAAIGFAAIRRGRNKKGRGGNGTRASKFRPSRGSKWEMHPQQSVKSQDLEAPQTYTNPLEVSGMNDKPLTSGST